VSELTLWRCGRCRRVSFPRRELCPHCGGAAFAEEDAGEGTVTGLTSHRGTPIACVQVEDVTLLARAADGVSRGSKVSLSVEGGAPLAASA
jgi:uncharacterized OB-fold protein